MRHKIITLLKEQFQLYQVQAILKCDNDENTTEIYNQIRAVEDIVVVTVLPNNLISTKNKNNNKYHYSLLNVKFDALNINEDLITITKKIKAIYGVFDFYVRTKTIKKIRNY